MTKEEAWLLAEKYGGFVNPHFEADRARLAEGEPAAYVIGWQPFLGLKIYLDSRPLIPRPETEWWVEHMCKGYQEQRRGDSGGVQQGDGPRLSDFSAEKYATPRIAAPLRVLDLCAGSGAIGCTMLAAFPAAQISFGELDLAHEATIQKNIHENGLDESRTRVAIGDLFAPFKGERFDLITCNPPYIPESRELPASVAAHEPELALRSGIDGLDLIRRIASELPAHLNPGGQAWIECDSAHTEEARGLFEATGLAARIVDDQYGRARVISASRH